MCNTCSQQRARLPELAMNDLQRVCNFCFRELNTALLEDDERSEPSSPRPSPFLEKIEHLGTVRTKVVPARRRSSISAPSAPENFQIIDEYGPGQHDNVKSEHSVPTEVGRTVVSGNAHEPDDKLHDEYNYEKFIHETNADKSFNGEQQRLCEMEQREGDGGSGSKSDDYHIPDYLEESETFENIDSLYKKLGINRNDLTLSSTPKRTQLVKDKQEPYMTMSRDNAASASNRTQQGDSSCCCTSCCSCCCSCCSAEVEEDEQYQALN